MAGTALTESLPMFWIAFATGVIVGVALAAVAGIVWLAAVFGNPFL